MTIIERQIQILQDHISIALLEKADGWKYLQALAGWYTTKYQSTHDTTGLEKSIELFQMALASTATTNHVSICHRLVILASHFLYAFHRNHNISYLEESISLSRHGLEFSVTQGRDHALGLRMLRKGLLDRFQLLRHQEDLDEAVLLLQMPIDDKYTNPRSKLRNACISVAVAQNVQAPLLSRLHMKLPCHGCKPLSFSHLPSIPRMLISSPSR